MQGTWQTTGDASWALVYTAAAAAGFWLVVAYAAHQAG
jgi:uncharacterized membrane protein YhdT